MPLDKNTYDPDQYKPSSDQLDYNTPLAKVAVQSMMKNEATHIEEMDKSKYKNRIPFIDYKLFTVLDPQENLSGNNSMRLDKSIIIIGIFIAVWAAFTMLTFKIVQNLFKLHWIITLLIYLVAGIFILYIIIARFVYKVEQKRRKAAINRGNETINLGSVWGINPGGIIENRLSGKKSTTVYYKGKETIILKMLKKSVLVSDDMADWSHYEGLQYIEDIMVKNGFNFTKVNMKYNTENDYIWDELNDSLLQSSMLYGKKYTDLMNEIFVFQRNFTKSVSTVPVIYYIIKPDLISTKKDYQQIFKEISTIIIQQCRCTLEPVSNKEFLRLLKDYYGVSYLDVDSISDFIAYSNEINIDVNVVKYVNNDGELIQLKEEYTPDIGARFQQKEFIQNEKDIIRAPEVKDIEEFNVYGDKNLKQYGA